MNERESSTGSDIVGCDDEIKCGINRSVESAEVLKYQETMDSSLLERIYLRRIPTMRYLALRNKHVCDDVESELKCVFMRAVDKYRGGRRQFNTYFFTAMKNHMANLVKGKKRKKRTVDDNTMNPEAVFIRMDDSIGDSDSDGDTYHDVIGAEDFDWSSNIDVRAVAASILKRSWILADIFMDMMKGACTMCRRRQYSDVAAHHCSLSPEETIRMAVGMPSNMYKVVGYNIRDGKIDYCIEVSSKRCIDYIREQVSQTISA